MENAIHTLRIQNFKSIKDVTIQPHRVNLIIGQPNVGKSNILEAMSLLGGMVYDKEGGKFMEGQIRYENIRNLFYDNDWSETIEILANEERLTRIYKHRDSIQIQFGKLYEPGSLESFYHAAVDNTGSKYGFKNITKKEIGTLSGAIPHPDNYFLTKKYIFDRFFDYGFIHTETYLYPPHGDNMLDVLQYSGAALRKEIADLFKPYGLNFAVRVADRKFEIQKNVDGYIYDYPYSLIADTLQRIIFYLAAIESNDDSVLLFEEPEAHQFPVYTSMLGQKIVESRNNQFFIATHSPYLVTEILESLLPEEGKTPELAIFLAYYEDYQTKVKQLSDEEIREIRNDSIDVFYNLSRFTPGNNLYA